MRRLLFLIVILLFFIGCTREIVEDKAVEKDTGLAGEQLVEFEKTACIEADKNNNCFDQLVKLDIIAPKECCREYGLCCDDSTLSDFEEEACIQADKEGTCFEQLPKLDIVEPDKCCKVLDICCKK